ncbi:hypothetical protein LZ31DRAFT_181900 [Colletotrichum somersetense]|nr:hypothetical protein LZ31DRAFT_181900 [Colletotrichum somersetense]
MERCATAELALRVVPFPQADGHADTQGKESSLLNPPSPPKTLDPTDAARCETSHWECYSKCQMVQRGGGRKRLLHPAIRPRSGFCRMSDRRSEGPPMFVLFWSLGKSGYSAPPARSGFRPMSRSTTTPP